MVLLGHSWGGPLILDYLSRHPENVAGAIVVGSGAVVSEAYQHVSHRPLPEDMPPIPEDVDPSCASWWPAMLHYYPDPDLFEPEHLAGTCHDDISRMVWQNVRDDDVAPRLAEVDAPILVWYGGYDPLAVLRPNLLGALRNADITDVFVEDCGHRPMFQCPDVLYRDIEPWMNDVVSR